MHAHAAFGFVIQSHVRQAATSMRYVNQYCTVSSVETSFVAEVLEIKLKKTTKKSNLFA